MSDPSSGEPNEETTDPRYGLYFSLMVIAVGLDQLWKDDPSLPTGLPAERNYLNIPISRTDLDPGARRRVHRDTNSRKLAQFSEDFSEVRVRFPEDLARELDAKVDIAISLQGLGADKSIEAKELASDLRKLAQRIKIAVLTKKAGSSALVEEKRSSLAIGQTGIESIDITEIPQEYRDCGAPDGQPLTVDYVSRPETYNLKGPYLTRQGLGFLKVGRKHVYKFVDIAALSAAKTARGNDRR